MKFSSLISVLACLSAASVQGAVVLTIDISNPSAVVFTSVANNSQITGDLYVNFSGGISIRDFFTQIELIPALGINGDWKSLGAIAEFNEMATFVFGNPEVVAGVDLSIYNSAASLADDQNLLDSQAPFTGSSITNMEAYTHMPAVGETGDVHLGFLSSQGGVIGQWVVIPEPSITLLSLFGTAVLFRRRR